MGAIKNYMIKFLNRIEKVGNRLPDVSMIFFVLCIITLLLSGLLSYLNVSVVDPAKDERIYVENLLNSDGLMQILEETITNFVTFPALGMVMVVMIGVGIAEKTGYFEHILHSLVGKTPAYLVVPFLIFVSILGNALGGAGPMIMPVLTALIFRRLGYNPIAGVIMSYAAVEIGYSANIFIGLDDALLYSLTESGLSFSSVDIAVNPVMNWYFMAFATFILVPIIYLIAKYITIPSFENDSLVSSYQEEMKQFNQQDHFAFVWANVTLAVYVLAVIIISLPKNSFMRNEETANLLVDSPFINGFGVILLLLFIIPGIVYGILSNKVTSSKDIGYMMANSISDMSGFIIVIFFAAQLLAYFDWSNIGNVIAIGGAELLQHQSGIILIIGIIILTSFINIFIGSASAKWAILAPIFIPVFASLGYHPAFTQMLYRIGDSITNPITPMIPFMIFVLTIAQNYDPKIRLGTIIAHLLPYSIITGIFWIFLIIVWYLLGIPVGPGGPIHL